MYVCAGPTDEPDDIEGGVGEDWCVGLIKVVVGLFLASDGLSGHTGAYKRHERWRE